MDNDRVIAMHEGSAVIRMNGSRRLYWAATGNPLHAEHAVAQRDVEMYTPTKAAIEIGITPDWWPYRLADETAAEAEARQHSHPRP